MDLYYVLTVYHILAAIIHKIWYNSYNKAHLIISNSISYEWLPVRLALSAIFERVIVINDDKSFEMGKDVTHQNHKETLESALEKISQYCFGLMPQPPEEYDNLYILADHFPLGFSLAFKNIPYIYFEESSGAHSRREILMNVLNNSNPFMFWTLTQTKVRGFADCAIKKYINVNLQLPNFTDDLAEHFSVVEILAKLSSEQIEFILYIFDPLPEKDFYFETDKKTAIIFTQHFANMKVSTLEEQKFLYQMLANYFCEGMQIIIKPHPNDRHGLYQKWIPESVILPYELPSELIPYKNIGHIHRVISATSTASLIENNPNTEVVAFQSRDNRFEQEFVNMNRYYAVSLIISKIIKHCGDRLSAVSFGADTEQIRMFLKYCANVPEKTWKTLTEISSISDIKNQDIIIIDKLKYTESDKDEIFHMIKYKKKNSIVIFINSDNDYLFYNYGDTYLIDHIIPVSVKTYSCDKADKKKIKKESIYMFSKNNELKKDLLTIRVKKSLRNCGLEVEIGENPLNIAELYYEGLLEATEKQCLKLTIENTALKKQLADLNKGK